MKKIILVLLLAPILLHSAGPVKPSSSVAKEAAIKSTANNKWGAFTQKSQEKFQELTEKVGNSTVYQTIRIPLALWLTGFSLREFRNGFIVQVVDHRNNLVFRHRTSGENIIILGSFLAGSALIQPEATKAINKLTFYFDRWMNKK